MKATLHFDLPDDQLDYWNAINGWKWRRVAEDMDGFLRGEIKYHGMDRLQPVRDRLRELLSDYNLTLDEE